MYSELTGYAFEGTFVNGRINGSGVLMTPAPEYARIVRIWEKPTERASVGGKKDDKYKTKKQRAADAEEVTNTCPYALLTRLDMGLRREKH